MEEEIYIMSVLRYCFMKGGFECPFQEEHVISTRSFVKEASLDEHKGFKGKTLGVSVLRKRLLSKNFDIPEERFFLVDNTADESEILKQFPKINFVCTSDHKYNVDFMSANENFNIDCANEILSLMYFSSWCGAV